MTSFAITYFILLTSLSYYYLQYTNSYPFILGTFLRPGGFFLCALYNILIGCWSAVDSAALFQCLERSVQHSLDRQSREIREVGKL